MTLTILKTESQMLRELYLAANLDCEYCLVRTVGDRRIRHTDACEIDHVWQRAGGRLELISNYMSTCRDCHEWKHRNLRDARIAATYWKVTKFEFDPAAMRRATGRDVLAWCEMQRGLVPAWCEKKLDLLLGR